MFLCGPEQREPATRENPPRPWWMRCSFCGTVRPYNRGISQLHSPPATYKCVQCPPPGQLVFDVAAFDGGERP